MDIVPPGPRGVRPVSPLSVALAPPVAEALEEVRLRSGRSKRAIVEEAILLIARRDGVVRP